ncbi:MAG: hypothetical protein ACREJ2_09390 [Planctomycetota bacterium]
MTSAPISDPRQWHRSRAWTDALVKALPPQQPAWLAAAATLSAGAPGAIACEPAGDGRVRLVIGGTALSLQGSTTPEPGAVQFTPELLLAADGTADGRAGVKQLESWIAAQVARTVPPSPSLRGQPSFWAPQPALGQPPGAGPAGDPAGRRRYRLRLDFTVANPHAGWVQARGGSFAEALAQAAQLQWYVTGSFLNIAERGAYAGKLECLGSGSTHMPQAGAGEAITVTPRFAAWIELGGGRDRLIQAAMELRRLADTLGPGVGLRGEMGLVGDPPPAPGAAEDVFVWSGSLNWGDRLTLGWEQIGFLRELVDFLVTLHRRRVLHENLLRTLGAAAQWSDRGAAGTVMVVRILTEYFDRHGRNRHFPPDTARRLALALGRNEKFLRHRPGPTRAGLTRVEELIALAVRLVRLQCGLKRAGRYLRERSLENNGVRSAAQGAEESA